MHKENTLPQSLKVLIVEDSQEDAELLVQELRNAGFEPDWQRVDTEVDYLDRLQQGINLVLSDYQMPQFSGLRALQLLKQGGLDVPFILISGVAGEDAAVSAMKQGATDYLVRNRLTNLGQSISQALEATRLRSERRRFEQRLLLQSTAMETAANAIVITDVAGNILWVNPAFTAQSGYTVADVVGHSPRLLKSGKHDLEFYRELWTSVLAGKTWRGVFTNRRKDGTLYIAEQTITPVLSKEGVVTHFVTIMDDVSERLAAEDALKLALAQIRTLLEHSPAVLYSLKAEQGEITSWFSNSNVSRLLGFEIGEIENLNWWQSILHPEDRQIQQVGLVNAIERGGSRSEYRLRHKDGSYHWVEDHLRLVRNVAGEPVELAGVWTDVTERKNAAEALSGSEDRFRQVVENIHEVFWLTDLKTNAILYVSPGYEMIWGRTCESLYAAPKGWLENIHEPDRDRVEESASVKQVLGTYDETYRIVRPDGTLRWIRSRAFPVRDKTGEVVRLVGIAEDITERKKMEEQVLRGQRLECIGMLASGIAHDLNNVLAPISMAVPLLRVNATEPGDMRMLDILEQSGSRGAGLVRQILGFVHGIGGEPRIMQITHLLNDIIGVISETFPKSIILQSHISKGLWPILANPTQIHQVLLNLCVNARDAMPKGGTLRLHAENVTLNEAAALALEGGKPGVWLVLRVEDTGTGIPPDVLTHIWEPFFTTKSAEQGTGLGLSTVRGIVEAHHGFIILVTIPERGTSFQVYLPAEVSAAVTDDPAADSPGGRGHDELILLVDDEEPIREAACSILSQAGYRVITAGDSNAALKLIDSRSEEIALVITDRDMPDGGGFVLVKAIRERGLVIKTLLISGLSSSDENVLADHEDVFDAFIGKPFTAEALLSAVRNLLLRDAPAPL
jgi:PAS domain S-box-containing protein